MSGCLQNRNCLCLHAKHKILNLSTLKTSVFSLLWGVFLFSWAASVPHACATGVVMDSSRYKCVCVSYHFNFIYTYVRTVVKRKIEIISCMHMHREGEREIQMPASQTWVTFSFYVSGGKGILPPAWVCNTLVVGETNAIFFFTFLLVIEQRTYKNLHGCGPCRFLK